MIDGILYYTEDSGPAVLPPISRTTTDGYTILPNLGYHVHRWDIVREPDGAQLGIIYDITEDGRYYAIRSDLGTRWGTTWPAALAFVVGG